MFGGILASIAFRGGVVYFFFPILVLYCKYTEIVSLQVIWTRQRKKICQFSLAMLSKLKSRPNFGWGQADRTVL
jgi:hypothetical protein